MRLLEALIRELDTTSAAQSFVNVFTLRRADATLTANLLAQLFARGTQAGFGGLGGGGGGFGTGGFGGALGGAAQQAVRPLLTLTGDPAAGATLLDLRITPDPRTNSLIVAGSRNDLDTIAAIIARLDDAQAPGAADRGVQAPQPGRRRRGRRRSGTCSPSGTPSSPPSSRATSPGSWPSSSSSSSPRSRSATPS